MFLYISTGTAGVIVLWLLSERNHTSRRVWLTAHRYAPPLLSDTRAGGGGYWAAGACFPVTSRRWLSGADEGSVHRRWQVAASHQSWRDGGCDILNVNNLHANNTSPHAAVKCGSRLHVSLMPSPPTSLHNSAAAEKLQRVAAQLGDTGDAVEGDGGRGWRDGEEREERRGGEVRENPQVTASAWLFHHLVPVGLKTWPTLPRRCQRLSTAPLVPRKDNKLFTLCCVLLCAKYCSFPHILYFPGIFLLCSFFLTSVAAVPVLVSQLLLMEESHTAQISVVRPIRHFHLVKVTSGMQKYAVLAMIKHTLCSHCKCFHKMAQLCGVKFISQRKTSCYFSDNNYYHICHIKVCCFF